MNRISGWPPVGKVISLLVVVTLAGAVFMTEQLASGDPPPPPPAGIDITPPPQPTDVLPQPAPAPPDGGAPAPLLVGDVEVPIPAGANVSVVQGGYFGDAGATQGIHRGGSYILFNRKGI